MASLECKICAVAIDDFDEMQSHQKAVHGGMQTRCERCQVPLRYRDFGHKCKSKPGKAKYLKASKSHTERAHLRTYHLAKGEDPTLVKALTCILMATDGDAATYYCGFCRYGHYQVLE